MLAVFVTGIWSKRNTTFGFSVLVQRALYRRKPKKMGEVRTYLVRCACNSKWSGGGQTGGDVLKRIHLKKEKKKYIISWKSNRHCSGFVILSAGKYMEGPNGNCGIGKHQGLALGLWSTDWCELVENHDWNPVSQDAGL